MEVMENMSFEVETVPVNSTKECTNNDEEKIEVENEIDTTEEQETTRKRVAEEERVPVLVRIPSDAPSCSSDIIYINKDEFNIGRKPDNDEVILSVWISRNHCIIKRDLSSNQWYVTNLSSTDTLLNNEGIPRNVTKLIKEGDVLQLSLSDSFKYKFNLVVKAEESVKHRRIESNNCDLNKVLDKSKSFVAWQENERKDLEKQLTAKQQEQEQLKQELEKLLQDQKVTKTCNDELNNQITQLQKKIEVGNTTELELQQKYRDLLGKLEEERLKFEEKLAEEKQKWQEALRLTKKEKEDLELNMVEQMEEMRERLQKSQQEEWQKKIDTLLQEEKNMQNKLQDEKQLLEQKLKEMEEALKKREEEQARQQALLEARPPIELANVGLVVEIVNSKNIPDLPILETIDLTDAPESPSTSGKRTSREDAVIDKVNHIMDEQMTCSICSELFVKAMTLNCSHTFCFHCIDCWIKKRRECPNCRASIISMTRSLVVDNFIEKMVESLTPQQIHKRKQLVEERRVLAMLNVRKRTGRRR